MLCYLQLLAIFYLSTWTCHAFLTNLQQLPMLQSTLQRRHFHPNIRMGVTLVEDPIRTNTVQPPPVSPATNLPNQIYIWRSHQVGYINSIVPSYFGF